MAATRNRQILFSLLPIVPMSQVSREWLGGGRLCFGRNHWGRSGMTGALRSGSFPFSAWIRTSVTNASERICNTELT